MSGFSFLDGAFLAASKGNALQTLLGELAAAAISAGGSGLANWAIWLGDTGLINQGTLGGNLSAVGSVAADRATLNGRAGWDFNGSTEYLTGDSVASSFDGKSETLFVLAVTDAALLKGVVSLSNNVTIATNSDQATLFVTNGTGTTNAILGTRDFTAPSTQSDYTATSTGSGFTVGDDHLITMRYSASTIRLYLESSEVGSVSTSGMNNLQYAMFSLGVRRRGTDSPDLYFDGGIYIVALCNIDLPDTERASVLAAINTYYGR